MVNFIVKKPNLKFIYPLIFIILIIVNHKNYVILKQINLEFFIIFIKCKNQDHFDLYFMLIHLYPKT